MRNQRPERSDLVELPNRGRPKKRQDRKYSFKDIYQSNLNMYSEQDSYNGIENMFTPNGFGQFGNKEDSCTGNLQGQNLFSQGNALQNSSNAFFNEQSSTGNFQKNQAISNIHSSKGDFSNNSSGGSLFASNKEPSSFTDIHSSANAFSNGGGCTFLSNKDASCITNLHNGTLNYFSNRDASCISNIQKMKNPFRLNNDLTKDPLFFKNPRAIPVTNTFNQNEPEFDQQNQETLNMAQQTDNTTLFSADPFSPDFLDPFSHVQFAQNSIPGQSHFLTSNGAGRSNNVDKNDPWGNKGSFDSNFQQMHQTTLPQNTFQGSSPHKIPSNAQPKSMFSVDKTYAGAQASPSQNSSIGQAPVAQVYQDDSNTGQASTASLNTIFQGNNKYKEAQATNIQYNTAFQDGNKYASMSVANPQTNSPFQGDKNYTAQVSNQFNSVFQSDNKYIGQTPVHNPSSFQTTGAYDNNAALMTSQNIRTVENEYKNNLAVANSNRNSFAATQPTDNSLRQTMYNNSMLTPPPLGSSFFMSANPWLHRKKRKSNPLLLQYITHNIHPKNFSNVDYIRNIDSRKLFIGTVKRNMLEKTASNYSVLPLYLNSSSDVKNAEFGKIAGVFLKKTANIDYENVTVQQLKILMKEFGLNHSGKKVDLIERVKQSIDTLQKKMQENENTPSMFTPDFYKDNTTTNDKMSNESNLQNNSISRNNQIFQNTTFQMNTFKSKGIIDQKNTDLKNNTFSDQKQNFDDTNNLDYLFF